MNPVDSFWRTLPRRSVVVFLLGIFFVFATIGSAVDIIQMGRQPLPRFVLTVSLFGGFAVLYGVVVLVLRGKFLKALFPLILIEMVLLGWLIPDRPNPTPMGLDEVMRMQGRLTLSGAATIACMALGWACFLYVLITEGRRYFTVHAEMELAGEIHRVLVPAIETRIGDFEFYGRTLPSGQVGGDLIDVVQDDRGWIAYIADVSGHGVAPGVLMGMVKSAARMQLTSSTKEKNTELLPRLNAVLYPIKKPEMFVTFGYVAWDGEQLQYSLAGHPAILHYSSTTREISDLACPNVPLAMFDQQKFMSGSVPCAPNDLFLLLTDGLLEVTNAKDEDFGLDGVRAVMARHIGNSTEAIFHQVMKAANLHGRATDDQSLLLVRRHPANP